MAEINWRKILECYIENVAECEGVTFIDGGIAGLSQEENAALVEIDKMLVAKWDDERAEREKAAKASPPRTGIAKYFT